MASLQDAIDRLPAPFRDEKFSLLQQGIDDCQDTEVYVNQERDFAFLEPRPEVNYVAYRPRVKKLALGAYKKTLSVTGRRFEKIATLFPGACKVLEVGAGDGAFLAHVADLFPRLSLACVEVDQNTQPDRDSLPGLVQYASLADVCELGERYDLVCAFHVLEHILEPAQFLEECRSRLAPGGRLIFEVPSLDDPLLSLYESPAYRCFYFQRQHPYVYSARSLPRLLEHSGLHVEQVIPHQRYGLENHLQWLTRGEPGGNERFRETFRELEPGYARTLEESGRSDAVIVVAGEPH
ncbi:MAG: class I SAM-dependent methyltransferase [Proteobacteria bacterium]|nr:class I SAM-dependent methyltransferase [Pseudomonadota bacterium]